MAARKLHHGDSVECLLVEIRIAAAPSDLEVADTPLFVEPNAHKYSSLCQLLFHSAGQQAIQ